VCVVGGREKNFKVTTGVHARSHEKRGEISFIFYLKLKEGKLFMFFLNRGLPARSRKRGGKKFHHFVSRVYKNNGNINNNNDNNNIKNNGDFIVKIKEGNLKI